MPVPKKSPVRSMNDLWPAALTSAVMKVFERVVLIHFQVLVTDFLDAWQFAYRRNRSVDDAVLHVLNSTYARLDKPGTLFFDFSSAFNTIQPHLLAEKLSKMKISALTILWVLDYLTSRPQHVKHGPSVRPRTTCTNTGAPKGTVLSPFLFSLYTADCKNVQNRTQ